jgi:hypothetical protein
MENERTKTKKKERKILVSVYIIVGGRGILNA